MIRLALVGSPAALVLSLVAGCGSSSSANGAPPPDRGDDSSGGAEAGTGDAGAAWVGLGPVTSFDLKAVWGSGAELYAVGGGGVVMRSADHGGTWTASLPGDPSGLPWPYFDAVWGSSAGDVYVGGVDAGGHPRLVHSADHGQTWQMLAAALPGAPRSVWGSGPQDVYLAVDPGGVVRSSDGGRSWQAVYGDASTSASAVWGSSAVDVYAAGYTSTPDDDAGAAPDGGAPSAGFLVHSTDGGRTWMPVAPAPFGALYDVSGSPDGQRVVACGPNATQVMTTDHGRTWSVTGAPQDSLTLYRVWCPPDADSCFFVTGQALLMEPEVEPSGSSSASPIPLPPVVLSMDQYVTVSVKVPAAAWGTSIHDVWAVGAHGAVWHGGL